ncbi:transcriptional activator (PtaC), putative [Paecilomyces variotii No. 5]|uniref:SAGA-associated factor 11 n=1 Tax=Byssochlamys spectabilis (strain No. 5 / NBRC 109023) TaxID=1356009 RepID=V5FJ57_BYSSN|nr:transcriptional activator (PtaC), putative [Paecilomyces variotii No. 5]
MEHESFMQSLDDMFSDDGVSSVGSSPSKMAGPEVSKMTGEDGKPLPAGTIAKLTSDILNDTFYNIIYDIVSHVHRDEKMARMRSAVTVVRQKAEEEAARLRDESGSKTNGATKSGEADSENHADENVKVETDAAIYDNGKVYLKGNPLQTTREIICPDCRLPRLLYPTIGVGARPPPDPFQGYCKNEPPVNRPGIDIHGYPHATDKINSKKKKNADTPASSPPSTPDSRYNAYTEIPPPREIPTVKCPHCPRYFIATRTSQHLDRCLGFSGRGGGRTRTPLDSGANTPNPAPPKRPREDDLISAVTKKKKPNPTPKKMAGKKPPPASKLRNGTTPDMAAAMDSESKASDKKVKKEANSSKD